LPCGRRTPRRRLDATLRGSRFSPRRHPWAFCAIVAAVFGAAFSTWHSLAEGLAPDPGIALLVWSLYAGITAAWVVAGYALLGRYLRLIRSEPAGRSPRRYWRSFLRLSSRYSAVTEPSGA
jgi:hypothetical protein